MPINIASDGRALRKLPPQVDLKEIPYRKKANIEPREKFTNINVIEAKKTTNNNSMLTSDATMLNCGIRIATRVAAAAVERT